MVVQSEIVRGARDASGASPPGHSAPPFAELWGDVVVLRQLGAAMIICGVISLLTYGVAGRIFASSINKPSVAHAYAMLAGLVGCVVGGAVCAALFKPKRELVPEDDRAWRSEAMQLLQSEGDGFGFSAHLTPAVEREMRELGLLDVVSRTEGDPA